MESGSNKMRVNNTSWQLFGVASSNSAFAEKLQTIKNAPEGELMRLFEYKLEETNVLEKEYAKEMFDKQLLENYGFAIEKYLVWLVPNLEEAKKTINDIQRKIDIEIGIKQSERFWTSVVACNIAGGIIAKELGIIDWDLMRIYYWVAEKILEMREEIKPPQYDVTQVLYDYILRNQNKMLVVNDEVDLRTKKASVPIKVPHGDELLIRVEPDTKLLWLHAKAFKKDCVNLQINHSDTIAKLKQKGVYIESKGKRLAKGMVTDIGIGVVQCACFDISNTPMLDSSLVKPEEDAEETPDEDRGD